MSSKANPAKQTKETARRAREIRELRKKRVKWEEVSLRVGILKDDGSPDTGLAYKIGFENYEPKKRETRDRLGLRRICFECMRGFRKRVTRALSPWRLWWNKLKPEERDQRIRSFWEKENE